MHTGTWVPGGTFLAALSDQDRRSLLAHATARHWHRGTALFHERQPSDRVIVLQKGRVKLVAMTDDGRQVLLAVAGPGEVVGEVSALDGLPRSATALAVDDVDALTLPPADLLSLLSSSPPAALAVIRQLAGRLRDADRKHVEYLAHDAVGRLAARLLELCERFGAQDIEGNVHIDLPLSQEELAAWMGASRDSVAKALQTMRRAGWVETERRGITVLDADALRRRLG